jgi:peptidoglycan/xylan/chitin deacetylase (PgdA/CDA1 family)
MLKLLKNQTLAVGKQLGLFRAAASSRWRQQRLLILCYHGLSLKDEHKWRSLFMTPACFSSRMQTLERNALNVLPLADATRMLFEGTLPPKSVVITFDDGHLSFYQEALPVLRAHGFPATVYQTSYYSDRPFPVFNLILDYMFWRESSKRLDGSRFGSSATFSLSTEDERTKAVNAIVEFANRRNYSACERDQLASGIAGELQIDYAEIRRLGLMRLMTPEQVAEISAAGIDVQLHTHRHRTPLNEALFLREIRENREWIASTTGGDATHFCYPNGAYRAEFLPWLRAESVVSATTCVTGLATRRHDPLTLPRLLDSMDCTDIEFEAWLSGVSSVFPTRPGRGS